MTEPFILRGVTFVDRPRAGEHDILIHGERIAAVGVAGALSAPRIVDADDLWIMPGCIDAHVHPIHNETLVSTGQAAPLGGVTTILHHLYPGPDETPIQAVHRATVEAQAAPADFGFHVRITPDRVDTAYAALRDLDITALKVFLAHSDPAVCCTLGDLYRVMREAARAHLTVIVHAEFGEVIEHTERDIEGSDSLEDFDRQRPAELEAAAVHAVCAIAHMTGCRLYLPHISSAHALAAVREAQARGAEILIETCPHYLFLTADSDLGGLGKVAPPLRSAHDRAVLQQAVADGIIDVVGSDHCGYAPHEKTQISVRQSHNGLPGLELLLPLLLDVALRGDWIDGADLVRVLATGPAHAFGLARKGLVAPGYDADLVLIDPGAQRIISHDVLHDRSFYSPYESRSLRGRIVQVYRRGALLVDHGQLLQVSSGRPAKVS